MIRCETFHQTFVPGSEDPAVLAHLRTCDACLDMAAHVDPDVLFRALGAAEMIPPGGVDAFVDDVMRQVRVRETESRLAPVRSISWPRRMAVAATIAVGFSTGAFFYSRQAPATAPVIAAAVRPVVLTATKTVVETYDSANATIVEVPSESADTTIVMIFDENLPADL